MPEWGITDPRWKLDPLETWVLLALDWLGASLCIPLDFPDTYA